MKRIYLDYASATPLDPDVKKIAETFLTENFANPNSVYTEGVEAKKILEASREKIARIINSQKDEIIFTSGGTESNSLAITGFLNVLEERGELSNSHIISSVIEHPSVLEVFKRYKKRGLEVDFVGVNNEGLIDLNELKGLLKKSTKFVSIMHVNNEIGTIEPIKEISKILKEFNREITFHTDASQSAFYLDLDVKSLGVDLMTIDGGKIYGPKSSGLLYKREGIEISPILIGGSQEKGLRPGTENLFQIVGLTEALIKAKENREVNYQKVKELRDYFLEKVLSLSKKVSLNGGRENRIPNNLNISIEGHEGEFLVLRLDKKGVAVSSKSTCISKNEEGSYVIKALNDGDKRSGVRFSLGIGTTKDEIDDVVQILLNIIA